jgi:hypothetical protein
MDCRIKSGNDDVKKRSRGAVHPVLPGHKARTLRPSASFRPLSFRARLAHEFISCTLAHIRAAYRPHFVEHRSWHDAYHHPGRMAAGPFVRLVDVAVGAVSGCGRRQRLGGDETYQLTHLPIHNDKQPAQFIPPHDSGEGGPSAARGARMVGGAPPPPCFATATLRVAFLKSTAAKGRLCPSPAPFTARGRTNKSVLAMRLHPSFAHEQKDEAVSARPFAEAPLNGGLPAIKGKRSAERRIVQPCPHRQTSLRNSRVRGCGLQTGGRPPFGAHACGTRHRIYQLRNNLVHYRPSHQRFDHQNVDWNLLCETMAALVWHIYTEEFSGVSIA